MHQPNTTSVDQNPSDLRTQGVCNVKPDFNALFIRNQCLQGCLEEGKKDFIEKWAKSSGKRGFLSKPDDISRWYWDLKLKNFGKPPTASHFRTAKHRWSEKGKSNTFKNRTGRWTPIHPYRPKREKELTGSEKRKIVERWAKMWDSALSDLQFERTVFENNPDAEQTYRNDNERINDGCQKLCSIAKMNQNVITMMMKKFVSGPPSKLYTLNRIEAAQCWARIINKQGVVSPNCCIDLPVTAKKGKTNITCLRQPKILRDGPDYLAMKAETLKLPPLGSPERRMEKERLEAPCLAPSPETSKFKKNPMYWLDPNLVPPVPEGFREEEFHIDPKKDPTGEIRRDLHKAMEVAKRYTRFAHIIERAMHVVPNLEKVHRIMDAHYVSENLDVRRQTMLHNFFSSGKMETSPEFKKDAMFATILSREDNPKQAKAKKQFPYILAEMSKSKFKNK